MESHDNQGLLGKILDKKYKITAVIGEGGMGCVYKSEHLGLKRPCAVKVIRRQHAAHPVALKRFALEAQAAGLLNHPGIIEIYDNGVTEDNLPYIVMEYLEGESLDEVLQRHKYLHYEQAIPIFKQACEALAHAHEHGVLHRDLKPGNFMIIPAENDTTLVKVVDFGIAKLLPGTGRSVDKLTMTGDVFGSPMYMSPEQCMGQSLDARSDIYALGCVMFQTLTGKLPFEGDTVFSVVMQHVNDMPRFFAEVAPDIGIPQELEDLVMQCLAKERAMRFTTARDLSRAIARIRTGCISDTISQAAVPGSDTAKLAITENTSKFIRELAANQDLGEDSLLSEINRLEKQYGRNCRFLITPLGELFRLFKDRNDFARAIEAKQRQLLLIEAESKDDCLDAAYCHEALGDLYLKIPSAAKAEASYRESLSMKIKLLGSDEPDTCKARVQLAHALVKRNRIAEAEELIDDALLKVRRSSGPLSLDAANVENLAANVFYEARSLEKSCAHFQEVSRIWLELFGEDYFDLRDCYMDMARCHYFLDQFQAAADLCRKAIRINDAHPEFRNIVFEHPWSVLAWSYQGLKQWKEAEDACIKSIEIIESLGESHPDYEAATLRTLADIYEELGQSAKVRACRERAELLDPMSEQD